jgi:hypothetical protein
VPGFNGTTTALNIQTGNSVAIMLGDQVVAFAQTTGHQIAMGGEQLYGIGTALPQEIQQLRMSPAFTLDQFSLTQAGATLLQAGQNLNYLLAGFQYDMSVFDGLTGTVLFTYVSSKCQNFSQNIPANAPVRSTYSFLALDVLDPSGNSIINDNNNALAVSAAGLVQGSTTGLGNGLGATV